MSQVAATFGLNSGAELIVERTMKWDASGYGGHTDKATAGAATDWFFAEGAQGFFYTYLLLVNPHASANAAHVMFLREGAPPVTRDFPLSPSWRLTIFAGDEPELVNTSFGARVTFDQPGVAERAMYFGENPLFKWYETHNSFGLTGIRHALGTRRRPRRRTVGRSDLHPRLGGSDRRCGLGDRK